MLPVAGTRILPRRERTRATLLELVRDIGGCELAEERFETGAQRGLHGRLVVLGVLEHVAQRFDRAAIHATVRLEQSLQGFFHAARTAQRVAPGRNCAAGGDRTRRGSGTRQLQVVQAHGGLAQQLPGQ